MLVALILAFALGATVMADELLIGSATIDITPNQPVALAGQFNTRISKQPETPIIAVALAFEAKRNGKAVEQGLIITCDLVAIRNPVLEKFRAHLQPLLPEMDVRKVILTATHTHTAPVTTEVHENRYLYEIPKEGVMQPDEYVAFLVERLGKVAVEAWQKRQPGGVSWTLGQAVVGQNRRIVYADGHARMYGKTNDPRFRSLEGAEDHAVDMLFCWNAKKELQAVAINLACPAQEVEGRSAINADFWHDTREQLRAELKLPDLNILGWCSAAGDQSPHLMVRKPSEERMMKARGLSRLQELGRRISRAVADTLDIARSDIRRDVPFAHTVEDLPLPARRILPREHEEALENIATYTAMKNPSNYFRTMLGREQDVVRRFEEGDKLPPYPVELHVLRIGDIAIATNPFELFLDYGLQMKARSPAVQTFLIQLSCGSGGYLPTPKAIEGGSYSALPHTNKVGPEGGQVLVDQTLRAIQAQWPPAPPAPAAGPAK